ncbi:unnamed protein product [Boreogadus saida]
MLPFLFWRFYLVVTFQKNERVMMRLCQARRCLFLFVNRDTGAAGAGTSGAGPALDVEAPEAAGNILGADMSRAKSGAVGAGALSGGSSRASAWPQIRSLPLQIWREDKFMQWA